MSSLRLPPLVALRAFEAAARRLSFKAAAEELSLTPTAISHQIRHLEDWLGLPLFERLPRRVRLTPAGERLYPAVHEGFDGIARTVAGLRAGRDHPAVTLSTTRGFAARWLLPRLPELAAAVPDADLHLHAADAPAELRPGAADLAIRYGPGPFPGLDAAPLLPGRFLPVGSPTLRAAASIDPARWPRLHFEWRLRDADTPDWSRWFRALGQPPPPPAGELTFSDEAHAIQAAVAGQGVALASLALVADAIADGMLAVFPGPVLGGHAFHLLRAPHTAPGSTAWRVADWLQAEAARWRERHGAWLNDAPTPHPAPPTDTR